MAKIGGSQEEGSQVENYGFAPVGTPDPVNAQPSAPAGGALAPVQTGGLITQDFNPEVAAVLGGPVGMDIPVQTSAPYLMFYHERSKQAQLVMEAASTPPSPGQPFVIDGERAIELPSSFRFTVLQAQPYWAYIDDGDGSHTNVTFDDPGRGDDRKKNVLSLTIIDTGEDFIATCTSWRTAKCPAPITHLRALQVSAMPEWVTNAPTADKQKMRAAIVGATGPAVAFRMWSSLQLISRTARVSKRQYQEAKALPRDVEIAQLQRVNEWLQSGGQDAIASALSAYIERLDYVKSCM